MPITNLPLLLAQAGGGPQPQQLVIMLGLMFAIMWFLVINPQRKQMKTQKDLLSSLKKGDEVVTQGGILGKIHSIEDKLMTLEVANGVRIRVLKSSVQGKVAVPGEEPSKPAPEKKEEK
ncbi:MAG: preprotein translocase subunit YajC [Myxococcaceae bacterium]